MGTTRRRKLSRRRQRGKGFGKAICTAAIIGAVASFSPRVEAKAVKEPEFLDLVSKWWNNPKTFDVKPSEDLADYIVRMNWATSVNLYPETCETSTPEYEETVLKKYLEAVPEFGKGDRVNIALKSEKYEEYKDELPSFAVGTFVESTKGTDPLTEEEVDGYNIQEHGESEDEPAYFFPAGAVTLTKRGGRRKQRRKTLRRKK